MHDISVGAVAEIQAGIVELHQRKRRIGNRSNNEQVVHLEAQITEFTRMRNAINNIIFSVRDLISHSPARLYNEPGILLGFFESNHLVGFMARPSQVVQTLQSIRIVCEQLSPPRGSQVMLFRQIQKFVEAIFAIKTTMSMYYHSLDQE